MNTRLRLLSALFVLGTATGWLRAPGQVMPFPDNPISGGAQEKTPKSGAVPAVVEPQAVISGWSFTSEVDPPIARKDTVIALEPGYPQIIFFFDALPRTASAEFRYKLDDYDLDWTVTHDRLAHYRRLSPGHYTFEVQAHIPGQPWQTSIVSNSIYQKPFFYQTWYFYILLFAGLAALITQLLRQHDQLVKGQMGLVLEERNRIASDCHDTLMAGFAAISWQLEATAKLFKENGGETPAAQSCELARSMVAHCQDEARRIIWDLRDPEEVTNILSLALSRAIAALRLRDKAEITFDIAGDEIPIAPAAVHHLVCIGQEAVSNAIRHAASSHIGVALGYEIDSLSLTVRDNGRGFNLGNTSSRRGHFGIPVMEERARKLGGSFRITSSIDAGTEVTVTVDFQNINSPVNEQQHIVRWIGL